MKLLLLFGDAAVGKMTTGQELCKITSFRLFHNHLTIEPVIEVFGSYVPKVVNRLRDVFFEEFSHSSQYGLIFTFMWAFDQPSDWDYVARVVSQFETVGAEIYYVELNAPLAVRLERNVTENRLLHKASKRDIEASTARVKRESEKYRCVSNPGEIPFPNYLRIVNTTLSAAEVALQIKTHFHF